MDQKTCISAITKIKRVLIFGGDNIVTHNFLELIKDKPDEIIVVVVFRHGSNNYIHANNIQYIQVKNYCNIRNIILDTFDFVIYTIGVTNASKTNLENINVKLLNQIFDQIGHQLPLIFISSIAAFYNETAYANSKLEAEEHIKLKFNKFIILRPAMIFGPYDKNNLAKVETIVKRTPLIPILGGNISFYPLFAPDLAKIILDIIRNNRIDNSIYGLNGPRAVTVMEMIKLVVKKHNLNRYYLPIPLKLLQQLIKMFFIFLPKNLSFTNQIISMKNHNKIPENQYAQKYNIFLNSFQDSIYKF